MRNFQLDITLSFEAESDAVEIMDRTAKLAEGFYTPRDKELIDKFVEHADKAISEVNLIVGQVVATRPSITKLIEEANQIITNMRAYKTECEKTFRELENKINEFTNRVRLTIDDSNTRITAVSSDIFNATLKLSELDNILADVKATTEACLFIKDMAKVRDSILTGGKIILKGPDDLNNPSVKRIWNIGA